MLAFLFLVDGLIVKLLFAVSVNCIFVGYTLLNAFLGNLKLYFNKIFIFSEWPVKHKQLFYEMWHTERCETHISNHSSLNYSHYYGINVNTREIKGSQNSVFLCLVVENILNSFLVENKNYLINDSNLGNILIQPFQLPSNASDFRTTTSFSGSKGNSLEITAWKYTVMFSLTDELWEKNEK